MADLIQLMQNRDWTLADRTVDQMGSSEIDYSNESVSGAFATYTGSYLHFDHQRIAYHFG